MKYLMSEAGMCFVFGIIMVSLVTAFFGVLTAVTGG